MATFSFDPHSDLPTVDMGDDLEDAGNGTAGDAVTDTDDDFSEIVPVTPQLSRSPAEGASLDVAAIAKGRSARAASADTEKPTSRKAFSDVVAKDPSLVKILADCQSGFYIKSVNAEAVDAVKSDHRAIMDEVIRNTDAQSLSGPEISAFILRVQAARTYAATVRYTIFDVTAALSRRIDLMRRYLAETFPKELARDTKAKADRDQLLSQILRHPLDDAQYLHDTIKFLDMVIEDMDKTHFSLKLVVDAMNITGKGRY